MQSNKYFRLHVFVFLVSCNISQELKYKSKIAGKAPRTGADLVYVFVKKACNVSFVITECEPSHENWNVQCRIKSKLRCCWMVLFRSQKRKNFGAVAESSSIRGTKRNDSEEFSTDWCDIYGRPVSWHWLTTKQLLWLLLVMVGSALLLRLLPQQVVNFAPHGPTVLSRSKFLNGNCF